MLSLFFLDVPCFAYDFQGIPRISYASDGDDDGDDDKDGREN